MTGTTDEHEGLLMDRSDVEVVVLGGHDGNAELRLARPHALHDGSRRMVQNAYEHPGSRWPKRCRMRGR